MTYRHWHSNMNDREESFYSQNLFDNNVVGSKNFFDSIEQRLPPVFTRQVASKVMGGLISAKTLSNLDAKGQGPPKTKLGTKVGYEREDFMRWLKQRFGRS